MREKTTTIIYIVISALLILWESTYAEPLVKPNDTKNTHILYNSHLFLPAEKPSVLIDGHNDFSVNIIQSNTNFDIYHFAEHGKQGNFDLETTSVYLSYIRKFDELTEFKAVLPFYYHSGGFMDHYIEGFHKAFPGDGLTNGGREYAEDNEIHIQYQTADGGPDINKPFHGFGDPSFFIKRVLFQGNPGVTSSIGVKPIAGKKAFISSNTTDMGIAVNADFRSGIFNLYAMAGYSYFYGDGIFKNELDQCRDYMLSSALGAGVLLQGSVYLSIQFYCHSSLYDTGIEKIDYVTIINSYTVRWQADDNLVLQFCFDEDSITYAAADIAFSLRSEYTF